MLLGACLFVVHVWAAAAAAAAAEQDDD